MVNEQMDVGVFVVYVVFLFLKWYYDQIFALCFFGSIT